MIIPDLKYTFYGPIVFSAIMIGIIVACLLMKKAGAQKNTVVYTALLTFISILVFSAMISVYITRSVKRIGFVGAGGALGLIVGAITAALIFLDHTRDSLTIWILVAPLMYGLSKIACHIAGCCNGIPYHSFPKVTYIARGESFFPVQITETFVNILIFLIGLIIFLKYMKTEKTGSDRQINANSKIDVLYRHLASLILALTAIAKIGLEFLRESHMGHIITGYQVLVFCIAFLGVVAIELTCNMSKNANKTV